MRKGNTSRLRNSSTGDRAFDTFNIIFMVCLMIVTIYPFVNMIAVSFNNANDAIRGGIYLWPRVWTLDNYKYIFGESDIYHATLISALRTVIGTVVSVFCTAMLAYTVSRQEFVLRKFVTMFLYSPCISAGVDPRLSADSRPWIDRFLLGIYHSGCNRCLQYDCHPFIY